VRPDKDVRVSAVVPYFNDGPTVDETLNSLRGQTRPVDQIVLVDDGSTDASSLAVLSRLESTGITVVRQHNQGPGPARNLGVGHTDGEAILFLDSDDVVTEHHVERALAALAGAPEDVGFVYPDMQFRGNQHHLVVMPPYNLYLLLHRNFCCMGGLVDRSVFDAGFRFRTDRMTGSEDWDFFVTLGVHGIFGHPLHGAPLGYRRWGYSRSDGNTERAAGLTYMRDLHPDLNRNGRLIEIKREWAPALTVVVPPSARRAMAVQTCDDVEVVVHEKGHVPLTRGRWVLLLSEEGLDALADETLVERVLRLVGSATPPPPITLHAPVAGAGGWRRSPLSGPDGGTPRGVVAEGHYYLDWSRSAGTSATDVVAFCAYLDAVAGTKVNWSYAERRSGGTATALAEFRRSRPPPESPKGDVEMLGNEVERAFRHHEALPLFMPAGGLPRLPESRGARSDGLGAVIDRTWSDWLPSRARRLNLVVDVFGQATLEAGLAPSVPSVAATPLQPARIPVGVIWAQPFPGTACLSSHVDAASHAVSYRVSDDRPDGPGISVLGYVPTGYLPGRIRLRQSIEDAIKVVQGPPHASLHSLVDETPGAFVEPSGTLAKEAADRPGGGTTRLENIGPTPGGPAAPSKIRGRRRTR
jgi:glycosyltransferase involved in cell wall biosynthesis